MPRELKPCGTPAAYVRHRSHGEDPCDACRKAWGQISKIRRETAGDRVRAQERIRFRARSGAIRKLIENHRAEYEELYEEAKATEREWSAVFAEFKEES